MRQRKRVIKHKTRRQKPVQQIEQQIDQNCCKRKRCNYEHICQHFRRSVS